MLGWMNAMVGSGCFVALAKLISRKMEIGKSLGVFHLAFHDVLRRHVCMGADVRETKSYSSDDFSFH